MGVLAFVCKDVVVNLLCTDEMRRTFFYVVATRAAIRRHIKQDYPELSRPKCLIAIVMFEWWNEQNTLVAPLRANLAQTSNIFLEVFLEKRFRKERLVRLIPRRIQRM